MNRKLKVLGLSFVAALALTAVTASAASASLEFTAANNGTTTLHGVQKGNHVFTASASEGFGAITCSTATFSGTASGTTQTSQTVKPVYSGCKDTFGRTVHVITNTLEYTFTVQGTDANKTPVGQVHVKGHIELTVTTGGTHCTVHITTAQTNDGITYHNHWNGTDDILVTTSAKLIKSTTTGGFFACGIANGEHTDGEYTGETIIGGTNAGGASVAITADGT